MKKIILVIFLMLGVLSFAVPKYVDIAKLQKAGYQITADDEDLFSFGKVAQDVGISVAFYSMPNETPKMISDAVKNSAPDNAKIIFSRENKRAHILKFRDGEVWTYNFVQKCSIKFINMPINGWVYTYNFVPKKQRVKDCNISVLYKTDEDLSGSNLDKVVDSVLNEVEGFLK